MANFRTSTLKAGKKVVDNMGTDPMFNKCRDLGGIYRIQFRQVPDGEGGVDLVAATVPGRVLNYDLCGSGFLALKPDMYELTDAGDIIDKTGLASWARISTVIHRARAAREKKNIAAEAERSAAELGKAVDAVSLNKNIEGIELRYFGGEAADGTKIYPKESPAISGVKYKMTTRALVIKLNPDSSPDYKNAKYATIELSDQKKNELIGILADPKNVDLTKDYLEVSYSFVGKDKDEAGRAAKFSAVNPTLYLEHEYPTEWQKTGKAMMENIATGNDVDAMAEMMMGKNRSLRFAKGPKDIVANLKVWLAKNEAVFGSIKMDDEATGWAAKDIIDEGLVDSVPLIKSQLQELVDKAAQDAKNSESDAETPEVAEPTPEEIDHAEATKAMEVMQSSATSGIQAMTNANLGIELDSADNEDLSEV